VDRNFFSIFLVAQSWCRCVGIAVAHRNKLQPALLQPPQYFCSKHTGRLNSTTVQDPTVSLNMATGLMESLVDTVQFARDRFDVYKQVAIEKVHQGEYKAEHRRGRK